MADKDVEHYLVTWGLEKYIDVFKEHEVDLKTLQMLNENQINGLIPIIGHRAILMTQIQSLKDIIKSVHETKECELDPRAAESSQGCVINYTQQFGSQEIEIEDHREVYPQESNQPAGELYGLLKSTHEGRSLLNNYQEKGLLDEYGRKKLCHLIINNELRDDPNKRVSSSRLYRLSIEIVKIFKKESSTTYFIHYLSGADGGIKRAAKGKLLNTLNNRRRSYRESGIIHKRLFIQSDQSDDNSSTAPPSPATSVCSFDDSVSRLPDDKNNDDIEEALQWLRNSSDPWTTVEVYWEKTTKARLMRLKQLSIHEYFNEFAPLNSVIGFYLLLKDFTSLYSKFDDGLFLNFPLHREKILTQAMKKKNIPDLDGLLQNIDEQSEEVQNIVAFLSLAFLMNTTTVKKGKGHSWRPSKIECRDGFITHIKSSAELQESITRRREKVTRLGTTLQPYIIILGPKLTEITSYYVVVDNVRYKNNDDVFYTLTSIVSAVDSCFKIIFALNAEYPIESANIWHFIQRGFYKLSTKYDKISTVANSLMSDLSII